MPVMLKCGHAANATDGNGNPTCAICVGIVDVSVADDQPDLTDRRAKCTYKRGQGGHDHSNVSVDSSLNLAFFSHRPDKEFDEYYCGCWGWD